MIKKPVKGILMGLLIWVAGFMIGSIVMMVAGMDKIGTVMILVMPIVNILISFWYLKKNPGMLEGIKLGVIWIAVNVILDIAVLALAFGNGFSYFTAWTVLLGYFDMILIPAIIGKYLENKNKIKEEVKEN
ncbi:MAG: hypothetical protein HQ538_02270 [Parcubacteria group bacterium]|nr:hypothetical protein [Parcubacteria group bacterium]